MVSSRNDSGETSRLLILVTGMPGGGKSTAAGAIAEMGFTLISMGDVIREEAKKRGVAPTDTNLGRIMVELRKKDGGVAVANLCVEKIQSSGSTRFVVDGIRGREEVEAFKKLGPVKVLAIHGSQEVRYAFLTKRDRSDLPLSREKFVERDLREVSVGMGDAIAFANEVVSNNNLSIQDLKREVSRIVGRWIDEFEG